MTPNSETITNSLGRDRSDGNRSTPSTLAPGGPWARPSSQPCRPIVRILDESSKTAEGEHLTIDLAGALPDVFVRECAGQRVDQYLFELRPRSRRVLRPSA